MQAPGFDLENEGVEQSINIKNVHRESDSVVSLLNMWSTFKHVNDILSRVISSCCHDTGAQQHPECFLIYHYSSGPLKWYDFKLAIFSFFWQYFCPKWTETSAVYNSKMVPPCVKPQWKRMMVSWHGCSGRQCPSGKMALDTFSYSERVSHR